jgi:RNA polymerase sigma-70 factor (ECF subfamily)
MGTADDPSPGLIAAVQAGQPEAIDRWFRAEHPPVWRLCVGFLADPAEADDVAQDAMLHLIDRLGSFDPARASGPSAESGGSYRAWRDTVVLNLCRDRLRRASARRRAEQGAAEARLPASLPNPHALAAPVGSEPERAAPGAELRALLATSLGALTEREREAFCLVELEGRPAREAAAVLGVGESTVRSLLTLARRRLRGLLAPRLGVSGPGGSGDAGEVRGA